MAPPSRAVVESPAPKDRPMLSCSPTLSAHRLELEVAWVNTTGSAMWVAAALPRQAGSRVKSDRLAADVDVDGQGRALVVRRYYQMPAESMREAPDMPEWELVAPGARYEGRMSVVWPLTRSTPYGPSGDLGTPSEISCGLGIIAAPDQTPPTFRADLHTRQTVMTVTVQLPVPS